MFKKSLSVFIRKPSIIAIFLVELGFIANFLIEYVNLFTLNGDAFYFFYSIQTLAFPILITTLFISYEYIYELKSSEIEESISAIKNGKFKLYFNAFLVLLLKSIFIFLIICGFPLYFALISSSPTELYFHIIAVSFLSSLLLNIFISLLGVLFAIKFTRVVAYPFMALLVTMLSYVFESIIGLMTTGFGINFWPIWFLTSSILPPNTHAWWDYQYGLSNEFFRYNIIFFWISLILVFILITIFNKRTRKNTIIISICCVFCAVNFYYYSLGSSKIDMSNSINSVFMDGFFYYSSNESKQRAADFKITAYDMDFHFDRMLHAEVAMELDPEDDIEEYIFTLFHDYKISSIKDENGEPLEYTRDSDYFTINTSEKLASITVKYSGYSSVFYSNEQAVCLSGGFAYYPWSGFHVIYSAYPISKYSDRTNFPTSEFTVKLSGSQNLFTNLSEKDGVFHGITDTVSVMGGFLQERTYGEHKMISQTFNTGELKPYDNFLPELQSQITALENEFNIDSNIDLSDYKIFEHSETHLMRAGFADTLVFDNHIFLRPDNGFQEIIAVEIIQAVSGITPTEQAHYDPYNLNTTGG